MPCPPARVSPLPEHPSLTFSLAGPDATIVNLVNSLPGLLYMFRSPFCQSSQLILFVLLLCGNGCRPAPDESETTSADTSTTTAEGWEAALAAVRSGESNRIRLENVAIGNGQFRDLGEHGTDLIWLEINQSSVDDETFIEVIHQMPKLQRVKFMGAVSDEAFRALAELPELRVLNLPAGEFGDDSLALLEDHDQLELLRFSSPNVTDAGLGSIAKIPKLRFLHLINTPITDDGLPHLYSMDQLESFYLDGGECTEDGLSAMIQAMPDLHFHWNQLHLPGDAKSHPHE